MSGDEPALYRYYSIGCTVTVFADRVETTRTGFMMRKTRRMFALAQMADTTVRDRSVVFISDSGEKYALPVGRKAEEVRDAVRAALMSRREGQAHG